MRNTERKRWLKQELAVRAPPGAFIWGCLFSVLPLFWPGWHLHSNSQRVAGLAVLAAVWVCTALQIGLCLRSKKGTTEAIFFWSCIINKYDWSWVIRVITELLDRGHDGGESVTMAGIEQRETLGQRRRGERGGVNMAVVSTVISQTALLP